MNSAEFWKIIDRSREAARGDADEQIEQLASLMRELQPAEMVEFDRLFSRYHHQAYSWPVWGAAYVIGGGCSDDGFADFRGWLISRGEDVYQKALAHPDSLAAVVAEDEETQVEGFQYVCPQAWAEVTGKDETDFPPPAILHPAEPTGIAWQEEELDTLFPELAKKFG